MIGGLLNGYWGPTFYVEVTALKDKAAKLEASGKRAWTNTKPDKPEERPKWLNNITSVFGYNQNIPVPSCFGIMIKSTWDHLNPFTPDVSGVGEAVGTFYAFSKYNQAIRYASSTGSRTFGTQVLLYPNKSSIFRTLMKQAGRGVLAGGLFSLDISLAEGLYDEIQVMKQGGCQ